MSTAVHNLEGFAITFAYWCALAIVVVLVLLAASPLYRMREMRKQERRRRDRAAFQRDMYMAYTLPQPDRKRRHG